MRIEITVDKTGLLMKFFIIRIAGFIDCTMLSNFAGFGIIAVPGFSPPIPAATTLSPLFYSRFNDDHVINSVLHFNHCIFSGIFFLL